MQIDFHHTATYVLARLAGFPHGEATTIAHSAQYVDDATAQGRIEFTNQMTFDRIASAHPVLPTSMKFFSNLKNKSNVEVWLCFHFLPGNYGLMAGEGQDLETIRRLVCTTDSPVAAAMCSACLAAKGKPNALHRLGISAHVYADTWAHRGFVGLKHPINEVKSLHTAGKGLDEAMNSLQSGVAKGLPLGHGMALTLPDQPYLSWELVDRDGNTDSRDNTSNFINACERITEFFGYYLGRGKGVRIGSQDHAVLMAALAGFRQADPEKRHQAWLALLSRGCFSFGALSAEEMDDLSYIPKGPGSWKYKALKTAKIGDEDGPFEWTPEFDTSDWKLFHEALKEHREEVLDRILPAFKINVDEVLKA